MARVVLCRNQFSPSYLPAAYDATRLLGEQPLAGHSLGGLMATSEDQNELLKTLPIGLEPSTIGSPENRKTINQRFSAACKAN